MFPKQLWVTYESDKSFSYTLDYNKHNHAIMLIWYFVPVIFICCFYPAVMLTDNTQYYNNEIAFKKPTTFHPQSATAVLNKSNSLQVVTREYSFNTYAYCKFCKSS